MLSQLLSTDSSKYWSYDHRKITRNEAVGHVALHQYDYNFTWTYFVTLTFNTPANSYREVQRICRRFYKQLNKNIFNRSTKALRCLVTIEQNHSWGYHVHLITENPFPRLTSEGQQQRCLDEHMFQFQISHAWNQCDRRTARPDISTGLDHGGFQRIDDVYGALEYITKEHLQDNIQWDLYSPEGIRIQYI